MSSGKRKLEGGVTPSLRKYMAIQHSKRQEMSSVEGELFDISKLQTDYAKQQHNSERFENDRLHLLSLLPEEVWFLIFEKMDDPTQLVNVSNSSLFLRSLLLPQRVNFMFRSVWKLLESRRNDAIWEDMTDKRTVKRNWSQILAVRSVCKSWRKDFDHFYENHPDHFAVPGDSYDLSFVLSCFYNFDGFGRLSRLRVKSFHSFFNGSAAERNVFIGRSLHISMTTDDDQDFFLDIQKVLNLYGKHIWYCHIKVSQYPSAAAGYSRLRAVLGLMPNLKVLSVTGGFRTESCEVALLQAEVDANPLPTFKNLQLIRSVCMSSSILNELLRSNSHLPLLYAFQLNRMPYNDHEVFTVSPMKMLKMSIGNKSGLLPDFRSYWPVEKLYLNCSTPFCLQKMYNAVRKDFSTSAYLKLELPEMEKPLINDIFQRGNFLKADLPHLTHVEIYLQSFTCLDFLLPLKDSLLTLRLFVDVRKELQQKQQAKDVENGSHIQFFSRVISDEHPNICDVLSKLRYFSYRIDTHDNVFMRDLKISRN